MHAITPFHVPKTTVVFPHHPRIAQALFNHQDALKQWAACQEPTCKCDIIKKYAPKASTFCGHVAARGIEFTHSLSSLEKQIASGSVTDTFFPDKAQIRTQFLDAWSSWCRTNALPGPPRGLTEVFEQIWEKHLTQVLGTTGKQWTASNSKHEAPFGTPRTTIPARQSAFAPLCIIACWRAALATHKCFRKFLACSKNKSRRSKRRQNATFNVDIRGRCGAHPSSHEHMHYRSAKKDFARRPIVSFVDAFMRPLLEATFRLLHRICSRITLEFYRQRHGVQVDTTFSVNLKEQAQQLRVFRGKRRTRASHSPSLRGGGCRTG